MASHGESGGLDAHQQAGDEELFEKHGDDDDDDDDEPAW